VEFVGDAILKARQVVPDMPNSLPATTSSATVVAAGGSTLPQGTYAVQVTQFTGAPGGETWGETIAAAEITGLVVGPNQGIQITSALQPGAVKIRCYLTLANGAAGTEQQYVESTTSPFTISTPPPNSGTPPQINRAWLPDTDGPLISASAIFGWINDGLKMISRIAGGLLDYAGVQSQINQPLYVIPQTWIEITSLWYDGYWLGGGDRGYFFRRNNITSSILSSAQVSVYNNNMVLEVYPQPARTAASTTLSGSMSASQTTAPLTTSGGFVLPFGFMQVDSEIMAYGAISGNTMTGLIRGLGGSAAVAHSPSAPVLELNLFWNGKRQMDALYTPGSSASVLPIPNGWAVLLAQYVSGRAKNIEHDGQYWKQLADDMKASIKDWGRTTKGVAQRRQIGPPASPGVYYPDQAGGIIIN
jgi:hypothetical protein